MWTFFFSKVEKINVVSMDMDQSKQTDVIFWEICVKEQRESVKFMSRNMTQKITGYHYFAKSAKRQFWTEIYKWMRQQY